MSNVVSMPSKDEQIAKGIHTCLANMRDAEVNWAENAVRLCEYVADAKAKYPVTKEFGAWWDAQCFDMNHQTRAALVAMGSDIERARQVIGATERRSIELIYKHDFRLTSVRKSPSLEVPKKNDALESEITQKLFDEWLLTGTVPTWQEVQVRWECGSRHVPQGAVRGLTLLIQNRNAKAPPNITEESLSLSAREKVELCTRKRIRELEAEFESRVDAKVLEMTSRLHAIWQMKIKFADSYSPAKRIAVFPFTPGEYKKVMTCLHPDKITDPVLKPRYEEAFALFTGRKEKLVMPEQLNGDAPAFPLTAADLLKMRK